MHSSSTSSKVLTLDPSPASTRLSRRHRITIASAMSSKRADFQSTSTPLATITATPTAPRAPSPVGKPPRFTVTHTQKQISTVLQRQSSPSPKPPQSPSIRATSPNSKSRYISRLRDTIPTQCVKSEDPFWSAMQDEARIAAESEPLLASFLFATVLNHPTLHSALAFHLANKLTSPAMPSTMLMSMFESIMNDDPTFCSRVRRDLLAVMERDPACIRFIDALLYFKGFHALQAHRISHILWMQGRAPLAYHLQSQVSKELQVDIHPAAVIGSGVFIDHATGIVIGETAAIGDNCSLLHHVTLGGSGKKHGDRHPKLGNGVLVGAGATLLGNISIGDGAQIGACSLVLEDVAPNSTAVGVPAKSLKVKGVAVPALEMKHERCLPGCSDPSHGHAVPLVKDAGSTGESKRTLARSD